MHSQLFEAFAEALSTTVAAGELSPARSIVGRMADYISVGTYGEPILLLSCQGSQLQTRPPLGLRHLRVEYGVRYCVRTSLEVVEGVFTVVSLRSNDRNLFESFCLAGEVLLSLLPQEPLVAEVDRIVNQLVEMLATLVLPSQRTVTGLWAELWLISNSIQRDVAVAAWHFDPMDRFDFAFDTHFIEVKATERAERVHEFAYDQLRNDDRSTWVASLKLRRAQNGLSISDLVDTIQLGLSPRLREKLVRNVFGAVGNAVSETTDIRFDVGFANTNLRFINAEQVPVVLIPKGSPISGVRFRVNLDDSSMTSMLQTRPLDYALTLH
jgi:Putative  PD-(D/E)XK family member, (DUF4420)